MYKVKETFEYLVEDQDDFCSVQDVIDWEKELGTDASWQDVENLPNHNSKSSPWGSSVIEISSNDVSIDADTLLQLIKDSEKLAALEAEGVDNWEGYYEAMKELNIGYQKDFINDDVLIKQYCK